MKESSKNGAKPSERIRPMGQRTLREAAPEGGESSGNTECPDTEELTDYRRAVRLLADSRITKPVSRVVKEYVQLVGCLEGLPVAEAAKHLPDRRRLAIPISVADLVEAFINQHGLEELPGARVHLRHFLGRFEGALSLVDSRHMQAWIDDLAEEVTEDTLRAHLISVAALFSWGRRRRYWPYNEPLPTDSVKVGEHYPRGREDLITPADFQTLLTASAALSVRKAGAGADLTLHLALSGLAGLRSQELARLGWSDIRLPEQEITVACHGRRAGRRVKYGPALSQWLSWYVEMAAEQGPLVFGPKPNDLDRETLRLADRLQIYWPVNALRNSWIAYSAAVTGDEGELAEAAGVPLAASRRHYANLADREDATIWFAIAPDWCVSG